MRRFTTIGIICLLMLSFISCAPVPTTTPNETTTNSDIEELPNQVDEPNKENAELKDEKATEDAQSSDTDTAKALLDAFVNGEINANSMHEGKEQFSISDLTDVEDEWLRYSERERRDLDNDGEDELYMDGPYGGMILDARDGKVVILAEGEGTSGVLSYTDYDNAVWICHADTSHAGRQWFDFDKYNGKGEITESMSLSAEYWDSPDDMYDENSIFTFNDENITMQEFEKLRHQFFPDVEAYNVGKEVSTDSDKKNVAEQIKIDGIYRASLWSSRKDMAGVPDSTGYLSPIVYQCSFDGNELCVNGSVEYMKSWDDWYQGKSSISVDTAHVFIIDENTVYQSVGGEDPPMKMTKEEFAAYLDGLMDSGLDLDIEVSGSVVTKVSISS